MKKQTIIAVSIFLAFAIIGLGAYYFYVKKSVDANTRNKALIQQKVNQAINNKNNELINPNNVSDCDQANDEISKNNCRQFYVIKQAAQSGDLNKCKNTSNPASAADCAAQASFILAMQKKDKKYCDNIINKTDKDNCLKVLAGMGVK